MNFEGLDIPQDIPQEEPASAEELADEPKMYELDSGIRVELSVEEFTPVNGLEDNDDEPNHGVFVLPGWGMTASDNSMETLAQEYAEHSEAKTFTISTRAEEIEHQENNEDIDMLYEEAIAISKYIEDSGLDQVTISGHSQGGDKAINLVTILQERHPEIDVKGLVLMGSVGLYEQESLAKDFAKDSLVDTPLTLTKNLMKNPSAMKGGVSVMCSIIQNLAKEIWRSKSGYFERFKREVSEMSEINPRMKEVEAPVVIISGSDDRVSNPDTIMPPEEEERLADELENASICDIREHYLQENVFQNCPYVRMLAPSKLGHHGLPFFRSKSMARVSNGLIDRFHDGKHLKSEGGGLASEQAVV